MALFYNLGNSNYCCDCNPRRSFGKMNNLKIQFVRKDKSG